MSVTFQPSLSFTHHSPITFTSFTEAWFKQPTPSFIQPYFSLSLFSLSGCTSDVCFQSLAPEHSWLSFLFPSKTYCGWTGLGDQWKSPPNRWSLCSVVPKKQPHAAVPVKFRDSTDISAFSASIFLPGKCLAISSLNQFSS